MFIFQLRGYKTFFLTLLCRGEKQIKVAWFNECIWQQLMSLKNMSTFDVEGP